MSLYEGAVKRPINLALLFGRSDFWSLFVVETSGGLVSGYRNKYYHGHDILSGCQCLGY